MAKKFPKESLQNQNLAGSINQTQLLTSQSKANWWQRTGLAWKAILLAIMIGTIPAAMVGLLSYRIANKSVTDQVVTIRETLAADLQNEINLFMLERFKDIQIMANLDIFTDEQLRNQISNQAKAVSLSEIQSISGIYNNIVVFNPQGQIIAQTGGNKPYEILSKKHIQEVLQTDQVVISEPILSHSTETYSIYLAAPIKDNKTGKSIAYISSRIPFVAFKELLKDFTREGDYYLVDNRGKIILSSAEDNRLQANRSVNLNEIFSGVNSLLSNGKLSSTDSAIRLDDDQKHFVTIASGIDLDGLPQLNWQVLTATDRKLVVAPQRQLAYIYLLVTSVTAVLVGISAYFLAKLATRPILKTAETLTEIGSGNLKARVDIEGQDEVAKLAHNVNYCLLYTSPSPRDLSTSRMPSSA